MALPQLSDEADTVDIETFWQSVQKEKLVAGLLKGNVNHACNINNFW